MIINELLKFDFVELKVRKWFFLTTDVSDEHWFFIKKTMIDLINLIKNQSEKSFNQARQCDVSLK